MTGNSSRTFRLAAALAWAITGCVGVGGLALTGCGGQSDPLERPVEPIASNPTNPTNPTEPTNPAAPSRDAAPASDPSERLADAFQTGDYDTAAEILNGRLLADPSDLEALFYLANVRASQGQLDVAIELLSDIPPQTPEAGLAALGVSAQWCMELNRYDDAAARYQRILQLAPDANLARRPLAYIYNRQGRRHEAVGLIRELCISGDVTLDELFALIVESDAMHDPPGQPSTDSTRPYWPIGPMGQARWEFTQGRYADAASRVEPLLQNGNASPSTVAFYGAAIAEAQDDLQFDWWRSKIIPGVDEFPEYWAALGTHLIREGRIEEAMRALAEALVRNPTDIRSIRRMIEGFRSLDNETYANEWVGRYELLSESVKLSVQIADGEFERIEDLVGHLNSLNRPLEAILWSSVHAVQSGSDADVMKQLNASRLSVLDRGQAFASRDDILGDWDFEQYPVPVLDSIFNTELGGGHSMANLSSTVDDAPMNAILRNASDDVGLTHRYRIGEHEQDKAFAIYQQNGGGVAALDFDLDGRPDLYLAQGAADPPQFVATASDQLFRNLTTASQSRVDDVTIAAGVFDHAYTLGVTSGDWNQDGFPDLATANIGPTVLLINQGDGTFEPIAIDPDSSKHRLSTSLAMGDINGDHLPDLYVLNYLDDQGITNTPRLDENGNPLTSVSQHNFRPASDEVFWSTKDGILNPPDSKNAHPQPAHPQPVGTRDQDRRYGLGVILTDLTGDRGNEVFIGNDGGANQLWSYDRKSKQWIDSAVVRGCAFGSFGAPTASMGIAAGDIDGSGTIDLHVTNFYNESSCLYLASGDRWRDLNVRMGLDRSSYSQLGFGTQAIDVDNNGRLDLVVGNGHVENLESRGIPFRHPVQLLENRGDHLNPVDVADPTGFWRRRHTIRGMIRMDFNRDGRADILVTDLLDRSALLINETDTPHHWLGMHLVGTASERDAIGAKVEVRMAGRSLFAWVTSGDGYLGKNESTLLFGLGNDAAIDQVIVDWPSGQQQTLTSMKPDQYVTIIENTREAFRETTAR